MASEPQGQVTLLDVYTRMIEQSVKLDLIAQKLPDHEDRLRSLERWKYALPGSLVLAVVSAIVTLVGWRYGSS